MSSKLDTFQHFVDSEKPDIVCISEHHLRDFEFEVTSLCGFRGITSYCRKTLHKGGVCIFGKSDIKSEVIDVSRFCLEGKCELAAAKFLISNKSLVVITVYKPLPFSSSLHEHDIFFKCLSDCLEKVTKPEVNTVIVGDFNIDLSVSNIKVDKLTHIMASHDLSNKIKSFTREHKTSKSLLDHVYTDLPNDVFDCTVLITAISDHHAQIAIFKLSCPITTGLPKYSICRSFSEDNIRLFCHLLSKESWMDIYDADDIDEKMHMFESFFHYYFEQAFPKKKVKIRKNVFHTRVILNEEQVRLRDMVIHWYYITKDLDRSDERRLYYLSLKKQYRTSIKLSKSSKIHDVIQKSSNKIKTLWNIVNESRGKTKLPFGTTQTCKNLQGVETKDPKIISNMFNDFFIKVSDDSPQLSDLSFDTQPVSAVSSFFLSPVSTSEVKDIIRSLRSKSSAGLDNVSSNLLKRCSEFLVDPLAHLINCSFESGVFPDFLKLSVVKPLLKKGRANNLDNFRPISIVSTFSKVFERAVFNRLMHFIDVNNVLFGNQFGFIKGKSTVNAMFTLIDKVVKALDNRKSVSGVFFDLRKAFDMVSHKRLLEKLECIGVRGVPNRWFSSYLNGRRQVVEMPFNDSNILKRCYSDVQIVKAGVPQGSILGPLLFIIYINDLGICVKDAQLCLFADDTSIVVDEQFREAMEISTFMESNQIVQWCKENGLVINTDKTTLIDFSITQKENIDLRILIDESDVLSEDTVLFLGLSIDRHLNFSSHIDIVARKLCSGIFVLRRLSQFSNAEVLIPTYYALIFPHLAYAVTIWGAECSRTQQLFVLQKKAVRIIAGFRQRQSCRIV